MIEEIDCKCVHVESNIETTTNEFVVVDFRSR